jgi:hypothetical protein
MADCGLTGAPVERTARKAAPAQPEKLEKSRPTREPTISRERSSAMKMIVKHHLGNMIVEGETAREAAEKLVEMGIEEATLIEEAHPHTGRVLNIRNSKIHLVR